jgi:hypothetical protein
MAYTKTSGDRRGPLHSEKSNNIVGRDRLHWRHVDNRWCLYHAGNQTPLVTVEPDSTYAGMYRIRFPDDRLSDMVNLTRAKDAASALALRSLNCAMQELPPQARSLDATPNKGSQEPQSLGEAADGVLAEERS